MNTQPKLLRVCPIPSNHPQADWQIGPVGHHRDSDLVEASNWYVQIARYTELDPEGVDHEIHRFHHWAVGWVEECAYRPGSVVAKAADEFRASLEGYPILDEHDLSMKELDMEDDAS